MSTRFKRHADFMRTPDYGGREGVLSTASRAFPRASRNAGAQRRDCSTQSTFCGWNVYSAHIAALLFTVYSARGPHSLAIEIFSLSAAEIILFPSPDRHRPRRRSVFIRAKAGGYVSYVRKAARRQLPEER